MAECKKRTGKNGKCCEEHAQILAEIDRQSKGILMKTIDKEFRFDEEFDQLKVNNGDTMPVMFKVVDKNQRNGSEQRHFKANLIQNKLYHFKVIRLRQFEDVRHDYKLE